MSDKSHKLIHLAFYHPPKKRRTLLLLRQTALNHFQWFNYDNQEETSTPIAASSIPEALGLALREWKKWSIRFVICGFRYTLPERDEHGINALFHQMVDSLSSFNGIYFDEELGHSCYVQNASLEAKELWYKLRSAGKL